MLKGLALVILLLPACSVQDAPASAADAATEAQPLVGACGELLSAFASCMAYEDWSAAGLDPFPELVGNELECSACHIGSASFEPQLPSEFDAFRFHRTQPGLDALAREQLTDEPGTCLLVPGGRYHDISFLVDHQRDGSPGLAAALREMFELTSRRYRNGGPCGAVKNTL